MPGPTPSAWWAKALVDRLQEEIEGYQEDLPPDQQVAAYVALPNGNLMTVDWISGRDPDLVVIHGTETESGAEAHVLAHVASVQIQLVVLHTGTTGARPKIGFGKPSTRTETP